jgi:hypothetical protein
VPKVRAFVDFAVPRFKRYFEQLSREAKETAKGKGASRVNAKGSAEPIRSRRGRVTAE